MTSDRYAVAVACDVSSTSYQAPQVATLWPLQGPS
jgi:hypothetical protein